MGEEVELFDNWRRGGCLSSVLLLLFACQKKNAYVNGANSDLTASWAKKKSVEVIEILGHQA